MADVSSVIGGILLRPRMPADQTCDFCSAPATQRLQGETDSWGAEWCDFCDHHAERVLAGATFAYCVECNELFEPDAAGGVDRHLCAGHRFDEATP